MAPCGEIEGRCWRTRRKKAAIAATGLPTYTPCPRMQSDHDRPFIFMTAFPNTTVRLPPPSYSRACSSHIARSCRGTRLPCRSRLGLEDSSLIGPFGKDRGHNNNTFRTSRWSHQNVQRAGIACSNNLETRTGRSQQPRPWCAHTRPLSRDDALRALVTRPPSPIILVGNAIKTSDEGEGLLGDL